MSLDLWQRSFDFTNANDGLTESEAPGSRNKTKKRRGAEQTDTQEALLPSLSSGKGRVKSAVELHRDRPADDHFKANLRYLAFSHTLAARSAAIIHKIASAHERPYVEAKEALAASKTLKKRKRVDKSVFTDEDFNKIKPNV